MCHHYCRQVPLTKQGAGAESSVPELSHLRLFRNRCLGQRKGHRGLASKGDPAATGPPRLPGGQAHTPRPSCGVFLTDTRKLLTLCQEFQKHRLNQERGRAMGSQKENVPCVRRAAAAGPGRGGEKPYTQRKESL